LALALTAPFIHMFKKLVCIFVMICACFVRAQTPVGDSTLPFAISDEKKLSPEDLQNKKEGAYVTGAPDLSSDPVNGFGYGGEGSVFFNGKRSDPFFAYTPYRARLDLLLFNTTRSQREFFLKLDVPFIFDTKWRLRLEGGYESNPNLLYFGETENSLKGLSYYPHGDSSAAAITDANYEKYESELSEVNRYYNTYFKKEGVLNVSVERSYLEGKLRFLVGYEAAYVKFTTFPGHSLLKQEYDAQRVLGLKEGLVQIAQLGLIYDTRDLETDPNNGVFAELTNELSLKQFGSLYEFNKTFVHFNLYRKILPKVFGKCILAARFAFGYTALNAPFFEYQDQWSSEGSIEGLGGPNTLRGFKQSRFLARAMNFNNLEIRCRFAQVNILKQHLAFSAVPFADVGGVWDDLSRLDHTENLRVSEGLGLRIAWNVNTILRFDYAVSKEDHQFFFNLSHAF
jgi:hypothetical protein